MSFLNNLIGSIPVVVDGLKQVAQDATYAFLRNAVDQMTPEQKEKLAQTVIRYAGPFMSNGKDET